jgi:NAD(P)-dependent dehydrogenase (short-subunit alcohol dehydrogenase family)
LARSGADVIVNYRSNSEAAKDTVSSISAMGRKAVPFKADMENAEDVSTLFQKVREQFGGLDILVLNAATGRRSKASELPQKIFNLVMSTNLYGPLLCVKEAVPLMKSRNGGRVVVVTTSTVFRVVNDYASIAISKAGIDAFVRYLAVELAL